MEHARKAGAQQPQLNMAGLAVPCGVQLSLVCVAKSAARQAHCGTQKPPAGKKPLPVRDAEWATLAAVR